VDRANEARNNFIVSLKKVNEMALTIGIFMGLLPASLGTLDSGAFEHDLAVEEMFGETTDERAATLNTLADAGVPLGVAMKKAGFSQEEIDEAVAERDRERDAQRAIAAEQGVNEQ
jgi:hypothetical protein